MSLDTENEIDELHAERKSLIYDFDKVKPENKKRYEEIQARLLELETKEIPQKVTFLQ